MESMRQLNKEKNSGKLYVLIGKSASGKDSIAKRLLSDATLGLRPVIPYTTRPIREGEKDGVDYNFCTLRKYWSLREKHRIIESRTYKTVYGEWNYFTADDGQIDLEKSDSLTVGTLDSVRSFRNYFGIENVVPIYIEVEDGERLQRALNREKNEREPRYEEMCRRFLADQRDFSEENLTKSAIAVRYENDLLDHVVREITELIKGESYGYKSKSGESDTD